MWRTLRRRSGSQVQVLGGEAGASLLKAESRVLSRAIAIFSDEVTCFFSPACKELIWTKREYTPSSKAVVSPRVSCVNYECDPSDEHAKK
jgi:hypothetical protein